jgi:hypothetical protein
LKNLSDPYKTARDSTGPAWRQGSATPLLGAQNSDKSINDNIYGDYPQGRSGMLISPARQRGPRRTKAERHQNGNVRHFQLMSNMLLFRSLQRRDGRSPPRSENFSIFLPFRGSIYCGLGLLSA